MDSDLAFCLGQFTDDQIQMIDDVLEELKKKEIAECLIIEQERAAANLRKANEPSKGTHAEDQTIVERFTEGLIESARVSDTVATVDNENFLDTLRAELSTKVGACANYLIRLRNLAVPLPRSTKFVQRINEATDQMRRKQDFDDNFNKLCIVIDESDSNNIVQNVQAWWKQAYGSVIAEITRRNERLNPAVSESNFAVLSPTSRVIDAAKKLVATRKPPPPVRVQKEDVVREFVLQIRLIDDKNRQEIKADDLIDQLNNNDIGTDILYAENWLKKRDAIRNRKEVDLYEQQLQAVKDKFARQRTAQEVKKLALAALLCRLAIGSTNVEQFNQNLKKTVESQKQDKGQGLPVITGDIKDPNVEKLPMAIKLDGGDMEQWLTNANGIRDQFGASLCQAFLIPDMNICVDDVVPDEAILQLSVLPPYGKVVVDGLNGTAPDSAARIEEVRKCCAAVKAKIDSIILGEFGLAVENKLMDPKWNRKYVWPQDATEGGEYWAKPIDRGGKPYFCPSGWKRFGIKVAENEKEFDALWGHWYLGYHGTKSKFAADILTTGLRVSTKGCFYTDGIPRVYVSPSIEYSAHPRYACPWHKTKRNGETCWFQLIFQCRINPNSVKKVEPETLLDQKYKETVTIDPHFNNNELEWVIVGDNGIQYINKDIICYGLMMRMSTVDPKGLPASAWWQYCHGVCK